MIEIPPGERFQFTLAPSAMAQEAFADAVRAGLSAPAKYLSCRWFYDARGSELFEQICELPEYYLTRTERAILESHSDEIAAALPGEVTLVELGSGSSAKTRLLIRALLDRQSRLHYHPIDISPEMLRRSGIELLEEFPRLDVHAIAADYADGLARAGWNTPLDAKPASSGRGREARGRSPGYPSSSKKEQPRLILFLGSTIGNFTLEEAGAFLCSIRRIMAPDDRLLLGTDLKKARGIIEPAYNDAAGVTAAFNKNLLARVNQDLGGQFDPEAFRHHAPYVEERDRVEMRLVSCRAQEVPVAALDRSFHFEEGEWIHTEICHKYARAQLDAVTREAGLVCERVWHDARQWFALSLLAAE